MLVPAFAVDRTELVLLALRGLREAGRIPDVPVYVDSPMALAALEVYRSAAHRPGSGMVADAPLLMSGHVVEVRDAPSSQRAEQAEGPVHPDLGLGHGHGWPGRAPPASPAPRPTQQRGADRLPG